VSTQSHPPFLPSQLQPPSAYPSAPPRQRIELPGLLYVYLSIGLFLLFIIAVSTGFLAFVLFNAIREMVEFGQQLEGGY